MSPRNALQIRAASLSHYDEVAMRLGLNPQVMLRKVGLTPRMLASPSQQASARHRGPDCQPRRLANRRLV